MMSKEDSDLLAEDDELVQIDEDPEPEWDSFQ